MELDGQMNGLSVQPTDGEDQKNQAGGAMSSSTSVTQNQQVRCVLLFRLPSLQPHPLHLACRAISSSLAPPIAR